MKTKINLSLIIITSIMCLLPLVFSFAVYDDLPEQLGVPLRGMDSDGNYNLYVHKDFIVFGTPIIIMILNIVLKIIWQKQEKQYKTPKQFSAIIDWAIPLFSLIFIPINLFSVLGTKMPTKEIVFVLVGIIYIIAGNYCPKIKLEKLYKLRFIKHLNNPDIWNKTHRVVGYFFVIGGMLIITFTFLINEKWLIAIFIFISVLILVVFHCYSFILYTKCKKTSDIIEENNE